jgi:uncharacterized protein
MVFERPPNALEPGALKGRPHHRIEVLDVLRGLALLGMFLVHFSMFASGGGAVDGAYRSLVGLLLEERFWAMFAMLFGAGVAIQLGRAGARGGSFVPRYLRRLGALAVLGFLAHAVFGFNVLLGYAVWGVPLLFARRWSNRALLIGAIVSAMSGSIYHVARSGYSVATRGETAARAAIDASRAKYRAFYQANREAQEGTQFTAVVAARLRHMRWFYAQWFSFLPVNTFTLFLLGVLAFRLGLFDRPREHRRLIAALMLFGVVSSAASMWWLPTPSAHPGTPLVWDVSRRVLQSGLGLIRGMWLAFTYMGVVLLLVARDPRWLRRLGVFGWTGRMALTNYIVQIAILDLAFSNYALGLSVTPLFGSLMALGLFLANAVVSRWWLTRFQYGPLEWLWRSITRAEWQRMVAPRIRDRSPVPQP